MGANDIKIENVSDTSLWVAYYRAKESERPDALFHDPFAKKLVGERGRKIAEHMETIGRYTEWSVIIRTVIIDEFILSLVQQGVDMVINLGAGLDARPYRMSLPSYLRWIEVDYPHIIQHKNNILKNDVPKCQLTRIALDLADDESRKRFLSEECSRSKKILVITEGVIPYLSEDKVSALATELRQQSGIAFWITEYFSKEVYRYFKRRLRTKKMKNAPFRFYPTEWIGFFEVHGWTPKDTRYIGEETIKVGRKMPMPWWVRILSVFFSKATAEKSKKMSGYILFQKRIP